MFFFAWSSMWYNPPTWKKVDLLKMYSSIEHGDSNPLPLKFHVTNDPYMEYLPTIAISLE